MTAEIPAQLQPHHIRDILLPADRIKARVDALVDEMEADCRAERLVIVGILRGSFMFLADLVRALYRHEVHPRIDFITLESYGAATESSGTVTVRKDITVNVEGADVILVDDILDTGRTLRFARDLMAEKGAAAIKLCALLDKPSRRIVSIEADYVGFTIEDHFVVGYGLDYDSYYRELPYISKVTFMEAGE